MKTPFENQAGAKLTWLAAVVAIAAVAGGAGYWYGIHRVPSEKTGAPSAAGVASAPSVASDEAGAASDASFAPR